MPELKRPSGLETASIFQQFGFFILSQRGSHIKLRRISQAGEKQTLTVTNHRQLDTGTCRAIFRQACGIFRPMTCGLFSIPNEFVSHRKSNVRYAQPEPLRPHDGYLASVSRFLTSFLSSAPRRCLARYTCATLTPNVRATSRAGCSLMTWR